MAESFARLKELESLSTCMWPNILNRVLEFFLEKVRLKKQAPINKEVATGAKYLYSTY